MAFLEKRRYIPIVAATLVLAGCEGKTTQPDQKPSPRTIIDRAALPETLPQAVTDKKDAAVDLQVHFQKDGKQFITTASGIRIKNNEILGPGHLLKKEDNQPIEDWTYCDVSVDGYKKRDTNLGHVIPVTQAVSSRNKDNSVPDIALMKAKTVVPEKFPEVELRKEPLTPGEPVIIVSWQPDNNHHERSILEQDAAYQTPATFGGIVLGKTPEGDIALWTGIKSYDSEIQDSFGHSGGSGSPALDITGKLAGILIKSIYPFTTKDAENKFGVEINGIPNDFPLIVDILEPTPPTVIKKLEEKLKTTAQCTP